jgi:NADH-quinone oxidoreductase subunit E
VLSPEEREQIEFELTRYPTKRAVCVDALKIVQRHRGWISDEGLRDIAEILEMSVEELDGVATFYNLIFRKPVGRHVVMVCDSVSCWLTGYEEVHKDITKRLGINFGETTADGRFTLLPIVCLGACDRAPAMMVDGNLHPNLDAKNIESILEEYK